MSNLQHTFYFTIALTKDFYEKLYFIKWAYNTNGHTDIMSLVMHPFRPFYWIIFVIWNFNTLSPIAKIHSSFLEWDTVLQSLNKFILSNFRHFGGSTEPKITLCKFSSFFKLCAILSTLESRIWDFPFRWKLIFCKEIMPVRPSLSVIWLQYEKQTYIFFNEQSLLKPLPRSWKPLFVISVQLSKLRAMSPIQVSPWKDWAIFFKPWSVVSQHFKNVWEMLCKKWKIFKSRHKCFSSCLWVL